MKGDSNATAVAELLAQIGALRQTLNADLDAVADALDSDDDTIAAEIIAATASLPMLGHGAMNHRLRPVKTPGN